MLAAEHTASSRAQEVVALSRRQGEEIVLGVRDALADGPLQDVDAGATLRVSTCWRTKYQRSLPHLEMRVLPRRAIRARPTPTRRRRWQPAVETVMPAIAAACRNKSGESPSSAQSLSVRRTSPPPGHA
jgi:hypothetical protein